MKLKSCKRMFTLALAAAMTLSNSGIHALSAEASETDAYAAALSLGGAAVEGVSMEYGVQYADNYFADKAFNGSNVYYISEQGDIDNFRQNIVNATSLEISITFKVTSASTAWINLLEIYDSNHNDTSAETNGSESTLAVIVGKDGYIYLEAGSYKTGTDWSIASGKRIDDGEFHTLDLSISASRMKGRIDDGAVQEISNSGSRKTKEFFNAFFGGSSGEFSDWRESVDSVAIGGLSANSYFTSANYSNLNGEISSLSITGKIDLSDLTGGGLQAGMFGNSADNTWLFCGGIETQGKFAETRGIRNYIGQFEEYVRWIKSGNNDNGKQRYTINAGKDGADASAVAEKLDEYIEKTQPKAVAYLIGPEDYSQGQAGIEDFKKSLSVIISKSLAMKDNGGYVVIQLPHSVNDEQMADNAALYADAAEAVVRALVNETENAAERIAVVDHLSQTDNKTFRESMLTGDGLLNAQGHYEIAKQFSQKVYGDTSGFPTITYWTEEAAPETYLDLTPTAVADADSLEVTVPGSVESMGWKYILTIGGTEVVGKAFGNPFIIGALPANQMYELTVQSKDGSIQLAPVTGKIEEGDEAEKAKVSGTIQDAIRKKAEDTENPLTWLFMGDSITHAAAWTNGYDGIVQIFEKYIKEDLGRVDDIVVNTAASGATAASTVTNITQRMEKYDADIVSIMLGTNDAINDAYNEKLQEIVNAIKEKNPDALIILRSPTPANGANYANKFPGDTGAVARMKSVADENGLLFIDQYTDWNKECSAYSYLFDTTYYYGQAIHPGAAGQLRMAQQFIRECGLNSNTKIANLSYEFAYTNESSDIKPNVGIAEAKDAVTVSKSELQDAYDNGEIGELTVVLTDSDGRSYTKIAGLEEDAVNIILPKDRRYTVEVTANMKGSTARLVTFASEEIILSDADVTSGDTSAAEDVETKLQELADIDLTDEAAVLANSDKIAEARAAYDNLTPLQQQLVSNALKQLLSNAEEIINQKAAEECIAKIKEIEELADIAANAQKVKAARTSYDALTAAQKQMISSAAVKILTDAETEVGNYEAADSVIKKINAIGTVAYTQAVKQKIDEARAAYNDLSEDQKNLVSADTVKILDDAETAYQELERQANEEEPEGSQGEQGSQGQNGSQGQQNTSGQDINTIQEGKIYESGNYSYKVLSISGQTAEVVGMKLQKAKISVPGSVSLGGKDFNVTSIAASAFKNNKKATAAVIGKNVETIGKNAFAGCTKLKKVTINSTKLNKIGNKTFFNCKVLKNIVIKSKALKSVGANALKGIHKNAVIKVPAAKYKAYVKLLEKRGQSKTVNIKK